MFHAEFNGQVYELTDKLRSKAKRISDDMNRNGMRVLAIAQKSFISKARDFAVTDEDEMVLIGYWRFLIPQALFCRGYPPIARIWYRG